MTHIICGQTIDRVLIEKGENVKVSINNLEYTCPGSIHLKKFATMYLLNWKYGSKAAGYQVSCFKIGFICYWHNYFGVVWTEQPIRRMVYIFVTKERIKLGPSIEMFSMILILCSDIKSRVTTCLLECFRCCCCYFQLNKSKKTTIVHYVNRMLPFFVQRYRKSFFFSFKYKNRVVGIIFLLIQIHPRFEDISSIIIF